MKAFFFSKIAAGRGCLSRGRRSTQGVLDELRRAWPPLGPRLPFVWQVQYTEPPGQAAAAGCRRWGRGCLSRGRRSAQSLLEGLHRACPPLLSRGSCHSSFTLHHAPRSTSHSSLAFITSHVPFSQLSHHFSHLTHHSPLITTSHLTPTYHCLMTPYHIPTHHHSSQLHSSAQPITASLLTPH